MSHFTHFLGLDISLSTPKPARDFDKGEVNGKRGLTRKRHEFVFSSALKLSFSLRISHQVGLEMYFTIPKPDTDFDRGELLRGKGVTRKSHEFDF